MAQHDGLRRVLTARIGRRRALGAAGLGAGAMTIAAACGGDSKENTSSSSGNLPQGQSGQAAPSGASTAKKGGVLRSAAGPLGAELDIHRTNTPYESAGIWHWAGNFLVRFNQNFDVEPDLAAALPEITDGGTTLTFKLNPAAKWQQRPPVNGRAADSEDVKFTFERIKDPKTGSPRAAFFANIDSIQTPDKTTVIFKTKVPEADLLAKM